MHAAEPHAGRQGATSASTGGEPQLAVLRMPLDNPTITDKNYHRDRNGVFSKVLAQDPIL